MVVVFGTLPLQRARRASAADTPIRAWTAVGAAQVDQYGRAKRNGARSNLWRRTRHRAAQVRLQTRAAFQSVGWNLKFKSYDLRFKI